jgi:DNA-binding transcriptional MerR regulator
VSKTASLTLTTPQMLRALEDLEGVRMSQQVLQRYSASGLISPRRAAPATGGRGHAHRYTLAELARLRLIVRLRGEGLSMPRVRLILTELERYLPDVLRPGTRAQLAVVGGRGVIVERPGESPVRIPGAQLLLPLLDVVKGNAEAAQRVA